MIKLLQSSSIIPSKIFFSFLLAITSLIISGCAKSSSNGKEDSEMECFPILSSELSNNRIHTIVQDTSGYIWMGTFRGLNRYNSRDFYQYFHSKEETSLCDNQITDLYSDSKGNLWVSTVLGINLYTSQDNFQRIPFGNDFIYSQNVFESEDGTIYAIALNKLGIYNEETNSFDIRVTENSVNFIPFTFVKGFIGLKGRIWMIFHDKVFVYEKDTFNPVAIINIGSPVYSAYINKRNNSLWLGKTNEIVSIDMEKCTLSDNPVPALASRGLGVGERVNIIHEYDQHSILINSLLHGLFLYDTITGKLIHQKDDGFPFDAPDFLINCIYTDNQNNLWIGSYDQGFVVRNTHKEKFNNNNYLISQFQNKSVYSVASDTQGRLWIATLMDGLYLYDSKKSKVLKGSDISPYPYSYATSICVDQDDNVWIAEMFHNKVIKCFYDGNFIKTLDSWDIQSPQSITDVKSGNIWVSTTKGKIFAISSENGNMKKIKPVTNSDNFISCLSVSSDGKVWAAQFVNGIFEIDNPSMDTKPVRFNSSQWEECIVNAKFVPSEIYHDTFGHVWIGTIGNGLMDYDTKTKTLKRCKGLACSDIASIKEDKQGNMWISTQYGLCYYDRSIDKFSMFYTADGTGGNQYYDRSSCIMPDGSLVFGGTHGLTIFDPINIYKKRHIPLVFEDLKIHNSRINSFDNPEIINNRLSSAPKINLNHHHNGFSISFAALDYNKNANIHYFYKLEGHDKFWVDARTNREAYYANLSPGNYIFKIKATNNNKSIDSSEKSIKIHVAAAPWLSWWAWILYILLFITGAGLIIYSRMHYLRQVRRREQAEHDKMQEKHLNNMNMRFFANISHEFRTPLTMISGPISQLQDSPNIDSAERKLLKVTHRNVTRMLRLVNQMMDFNNLEDDTLRLQVEYTDIASYISHMVEIFSVNASEKEIILQTSGLEDSCNTWADIDKIEKICSNLLSNAIKYTPRGGRVELSLDIVNNSQAKSLAESNGCRLSEEGNYIKLQLADTGSGIPEDCLQKIFDRYYRIIEGNAKAMGTGIGLYYARALANLHHGCLYAENRKEENITGSVFTLLIPTEEKAYAKDRKVTHPQQPSLPASSVSAEDEGRYREDECERDATLLIVDDDTDVINYLKVLLSPLYNVITCFDATQAYQKALEFHPDLIVSDVLMPGVDGYELCRRLKNDLQLCHIPVILVTAKASMQNQIDGLNTGADAYVTKPFEPKYLMAMIKSLLDNRLRAKSIINNATDTDTIEQDVLSEPDKAFMNDLYSLLEAELSNSELDINSLCEHLHISRTKLYYKIKGLAGTTPATFFKTYKLNRAAELLAEGKYNISEIADITGFSTPAHFSTSFKKHFGVSPSSYNPGDRKKVDMLS